jgi:hypothetical protein
MIDLKLHQIRRLLTCTKLVHGALHETEAVFFPFIISIITAYIRGGCDDAEIFRHFPVHIQLKFKVAYLVEK